MQGELAQSIQQPIGMLFIYISHIFCLFPYIYFRFNPVLCYSISVNLLEECSVTKKNKCDFNVLSVKNQF